MAEQATRKPKRVVALNGDKLGLVAGATVATVVMALCFYARSVDIATTLIRTGWAFVIAYGATFFLVRVILRLTILEFVIQKREKKPKVRSNEEPSTEAAAAQQVGTPPAEA